MSGDVFPSEEMLVSHANIEACVVSGQYGIRTILFMYSNKQGSKVGPIRVEKTALHI